MPTLYALDTVRQGYITVYTLDNSYLLEGNKLGSMLNLCQITVPNTGHNLGIERVFFIKDQQWMVTDLPQIL